MLENIMEWYPDNQFTKADGFDEAIIGVDEVNLKLIYSQKKVMDILVNRYDMDEEEAYEHFEYNIHQAYVGEFTPIWCIDMY